MYANPVNQLMCAAGAYKNRYKLLIQNNAKAGEKKTERSSSGKEKFKKSPNKFHLSGDFLLVSFSLRCFFFFFFLIRFSRSFVYKNAGDLID